MNTSEHRARRTDTHALAPARRRALAFACLGAWSAALGACSPTEPTEIVAGVSTQIRVPDHLQAVGIVVQTGGQVVFCENYPVTDGTASLPATLGVLGESGLSTRGTVTVQVLGIRQEESAFSQDCLLSRPESIDEVQLIRRRRLTFVDDRIKFLPLPLKESCNEKKDCADDETCVGGKCVEMDVDATTLANYDDALIFGDTNTCFDANRCMAEGFSVPVLLEDAETCTFSALWPDSAPEPEAGNLNVRLYYQSFGTEILDLDSVDLEDDQKEGFAFEDAEEPLRFRLAPNLCETNYQLDKVLAIDASALCPAKRALQPICDDYEPPDPRAGSGSSGGGDDSGVCAIAGLEAVESAIYVLMDRSASMSKFFGDGGLRFAVELPLSSPVARRTKVGFELLPPEADQCGTSEYDTPQIPFGGVDAARGPIGDLLQGGEVVLDDDPPQFFLEAALQGAYEGVLAVRPNEEERGFNRRAVVVISNRDLSAGPCPGPTAVELAQAAVAAEDRVFTYAVALDDGEAGALQSAALLASAGGTTVFNGVTDEAEGARAVNDILTELGTCLYKVNGNDDEPLPTDANVSYIDPAFPASSGVDIEHNPLCVEDAGSDVSGWNQEPGEPGAPGLVRLCGQACDDLRQVIGDVGVFHATQGRVPPAVPLVVTAPCR